ncbi:MAG: hypothetical protein ACE5JR_05660 [Gemmatimonadota bacterium]
MSGRGGRPKWKFDFREGDLNNPGSGRDARALLGLVAVLCSASGLRSPELAAAQTPPRLPVGSDELVEIIDHREERVLEMVVGPAELSTEGHHVRLPIQLVELPLEGWLHGFEWEITDSRGHRLPDDLLHHINLIDPDRRELFSPIPRRIMAAGRETTRQEMPRLLGYPVESGTRVLVSAMFARPTERDYEQVYLHVRLFYSLESDGLIRPRDVYPFYLDVMGPVGPKSFRIPPGGTVRSWTGSPAIDGRILAIGAHLHDHARFIRLEDVTLGKVVWETEPNRDAEGHVQSVTTEHLWWRGGAKIYKDHEYRIVVAYDNPTDSYDPEPGMGEIGGVILASGDAEWPELDAESPMYVADLRNTLDAPRKLHGH